MDKTRLSALLVLLQDENPRIASLAMEQLLQSRTVAERTIAEHQEAQDPQLRHRIHQLSSILSRRRERLAFTQALTREELSLWQGVIQINAVYDPSTNVSSIRATVDEIKAGLSGEGIATPQVASLMREKGFGVPSADILDQDLYLIERVLESRYGSAPVLCALAQHMADGSQWPSTVVLHEGRFCLIDRGELLLDPSEGWHISKLKASDRIHPCSRRDVLLGLLTQLFLVALIEGHLRDLHHVGSLLTGLNDSDLDGLPYPLGLGRQVRAPYPDDNQSVC